MRTFKITDEQIEALRPYLPNIDKLVEGDAIEFQNQLDDAIIYYMEGEHFEPTPTSDKLQQIYDEIYIANEEN